MFRKLLKEERGNVAVITAFVLPVLIGFAGGAVDYGKLTTERSKLQGALDTTVLAAASGEFGPPSDIDKDEARAHLVAVYEAAGGENADALEFELERMSDKESAQHQSRSEGSEPDPAKETMKKYMIWGSAGGSVDTPFIDFFMNLAPSPAHASAGDGAKIRVYSESLAGIHKNLEIVLVLDNTGSMAGSKMSVLKEATGNFTDSMKDLAKYSDKNSIKMGLVPFSTALRFEANVKNEPWIYYRDKKNKDGSSVCIWDRPAGYDANVDYDTPGAEQGFPATENYYVYNSLYVQKHCDLAHVVELTDNLSRIGAGINAMKASGNTNIALGLNWGWNLLDPNAPFTEGAEMDDKQTLKVIILLTDGQNTFNRRGYDEENRWYNSAYRDIPTEENCTALKDTEILVYTIRVINGNRSLLRNCATEPEMFYDIDSADEMNLVFEQIAAHIRQVRLTF